MSENQTLQAYLTEPYSATDTSCVLDDVITISQFLKELPTTKGQKSFTDMIGTDPINKKPHGLITLDSIFDPKNCYQEEGHPESFVDDINDFLDQYGNWEVTETSGDNTYNYNSPVEDYVNMNQITIVNPDSEAYESKDIVLMSAGLSLDPRGGYTDDVIAIFDNDLDEHYDSQGFLMTRFELIDGSLNHAGHKYNYGIQSTMSNESYFLDLNEDNFNTPDALTDEFEINFDPDDPLDMKNAIQNALNEALDEKHEVTNLTTEYLSEMQD